LSLDHALVGEVRSLIASHRYTQAFRVATDIESFDLRSTMLKQCRSLLVGEQGKCDHFLLVRDGDYVDQILSGDRGAGVTLGRVKLAVVVRPGDKVPRGPFRVKSSFAVPAAHDTVWLGNTGLKVRIQDVARVPFYERMPGRYPPHSGNVAGSVADYLVVDARVRNQISAVLMVVYLGLEPGVGWCFHFRDTLYYYKPKLIKEWGENE